MKALLKRIPIILCAALLFTAMPIESCADQTVYTTKSGKKYHRKRNCTGLNNANEIFTSTESKAKSQNLKKCNKCWNVKTVKEKRIIIGKSKADIGDGIVYLENASGTTKNGKPIEEHVSSDTTMAQIVYIAEEFNSARPTYIYVDGRLNCKKRLTEDCKGTFNISGEDLASGTHLVEFVQYKGKPSAVNVLTHKTAKYMIIVE